MEKMPLVTVWTKLYRREWLIHHGITMYDGMSEDNAMHAMLAAVAKRVYFYHESLYCYTIDNPDSLMTKMRTKTHVAFAHSMDFAMPYSWYVSPAGQYHISPHPSPSETP